MREIAMQAANRSSHRRLISMGAAVLCLLCLPCRGWASAETDKPITVGIAPITPEGGPNAPAEEKLPHMESGVRRLQVALFKAWDVRTRKTKKKIAIAPLEEEFHALAVEQRKAEATGSGSAGQQTLKMAVADYVIVTKYIVVRNQARTTATLAPRKLGAVVHSVESSFNPEEPTAFIELADKLADALAEDLKMEVEVPSFRLVFCPFETQGRPESAGQWLLPVTLRQLIRSVFGRRGLYRVTVDSGESSCPDLGARTAQASPADQPVILYVRETITFLGADQIVIQLRIGAEGADRECKQERDLAQRAVVEDLTEQLWSALNRKLVE